MKIDFWRAAGVTAGALMVSGFVWLITYPVWAVSVPAFVAKDILLTLVIAAWFAWIYFASKVPSVREGLNLGLFMVVVPFALSFVMGFAAALAGFPEYGYPGSDMPMWYLTFSLYLTVLIPVATTATAWYLAKHN